LFKSFNLTAALENNEEVKTETAAMETRLARGELTAGTAARKLFRMFMK
jgi:hypothetical protein